MKISSKLLNITLLFIIFYIIYEISPLFVSFIIVMKRIIVPIFISVLCYYLLNPVYDKICRKYMISKKIFAVILIIFLIFVLIIYISFIVPIVFRFLNVVFNNYIHLFERVDIGKNVVDILKKSPNIVNIIINVVINIIFVLLMTYLLLTKSMFIKSIIYNNFHDREYKLLKNINNDIGKYIKSLEIIVLIETFEYILFYFIIGHPNFLTLGIISGLSNIVPYVGSLFSTFVALISSVNVSKNLFILTSLGCLIIPIFDNYFVDPKIFSNNLKISFVKVLLIIFITNIIFGIKGLFIVMIVYILIKNIFEIYFKK